MSGTMIPTTSRITQAVSFSTLPIVIRERLHQANVHTLAQWRSLQEGRFRIFGITSKMAQEIDALSEASK